LSSLSDLRLVRIAAFGALVAVLGLAGCGRKSGLDPPPAAVADPSAAGQTAPGTEVGPDGKVAAAPPAPGLRRRTYLDWLLD
jgi:predicted small lipoprotein YifL